MSYYVWGTGISYQQYLLAKSFVSDVTTSVSGTGKRIHLEVEKQTRQLIASNESLLRQNLQLVESTTEGFDTVSYQLEAISDQIAELNSTFHWGFSQVIAQLGHMNDSLAELVQIAKNPIQTTAYNHFENARDAFRQHLYPECLDELRKAIGGDHTTSGYRLEWRFHQMVGTLQLGFVDGDLSLIDLPRSEEAFLMAARFARMDYREDAARAFLSAGWAAYCHGDMSGALDHTEEAIKLSPDWGEAIFQEAKILIASGAVDRGMDRLYEAVHIDRGYLLKAAGDGDFQKHPKELSDLIGKLRQGARNYADTAIISTQAKIEEMKEWHACQGAPSQYESAVRLFGEASDATRSSSYYGYMDAQSMSEKASAIAENAIVFQRAQLDRHAHSLQKHVEAVWDEANDLRDTAPTEDGRALRRKETAEKLLELDTYPKHVRATAELRENLNLSWIALNRSMDARERKMRDRLTFALMLSFLWPLGIPPFISTGMWDWEKVTPLESPIEPGWVVLGLFFLPLTAIAAFFIFIVVLSSYDKNRKTVIRRYSEERESLIPTPSDHAARRTGRPSLAWPIQSQAVSARTRPGSDSRLARNASTASTLSSMLR